jgi:ribosomal protein S18 acetylase RimI-like enzyme
MSSRVSVRRARAEDASAMARVNVESWRETYRGLMSDQVLDDPDFLPKREQFWCAALTDERYAENRAAVAEQNGEIVGIAMSGPALDEDAYAALQMYVLYLLAAHHGSGAAGELLDAVLPPSESACLWVADPNPRAQAFYRKQGFRPDGAVRVEEGVRAIRMRRDACAGGPALPGRNAVG